MATKKKSGETPKRKKKVPPNVTITVSEGDMEQLTLNPFNPIDNFDTDSPTSANGQTDPIEANIRKKVPPDSIYFPVSVHRSLSTTEAVSRFFRNLSSSEEEVVARSKTARAKVTVDTDRLGLPSSFTEFDRAVVEAVLSQIAAGNKVMTSAMIFRTMSGKDGGTNCSDEILDAVDASILKCMTMKISLPVIGRNGKTETYVGTVLNVIQNRRNMAGHDVSTYEIQSVPAIYSFSSSIGAITVSPIEMLSVPMSMTKRSLAIMNALQRAVAPFVWNFFGETMIDLDDTNSYTPPPITIFYDDLYAVAAEQDGKMYETVNGKPKYTWSLMDKARETVKTVLDYWKKRGYIEEWKNNVRVRKIESVTIHLFPIHNRFLPLPNTTPIEPPQLIPTVEDGHTSNTRK